MCICIYIYIMSTPANSHRPWKCRQLLVESNVPTPTWQMLVGRWPLNFRSPLSLRRPTSCSAIWWHHTCNGARYVNSNNVESCFKVRMKNSQQQQQQQQQQGQQEQPQKKHQKQTKNIKSIKNTKKQPQPPRWKTRFEVVIYLKSSKVHIYIYALYKNMYIII